ncbi:MAG TPA: AtpZ/AtpI family protein [Thermoanaerobaculia bacterium]
MAANKNDERGWWKAFAEITTLGVTFPAAIAMGYLFGWWLDRALGTHPWLKIVMTALGLAAAFVQLFRLAARNDRSGPPGDDSLDR